jgi:hypothetical protein
MHMSKKHSEEIMAKMIRTPLSYEGYLVRQVKTLNWQMECNLHLESHTSGQLRVVRA